MHLSGLDFKINKLIMLKVIKDKSSNFGRKLDFLNFYLFYFIFCLFVFFFRVAPAAYGGSQARGQIRAVAASLYHSHSNARSELCL